MSDPLLLSRDELVCITGYRRARDQVAWITEHYAIRAYVNSLGEAVVIRAHLEASYQPEQNARARPKVRAA